MNTDTGHYKSLQPFQPHLYATHFQTSGHFPQATVNVTFWSGYDLGHSGKAEASSWLSRPHQLPRSRTNKNCPGKTQVTKLLGRCTARYGCGYTPNPAMRQPQQRLGHPWHEPWALWTEWTATGQPRQESGQRLVRRPRGRARFVTGHIMPLRPTPDHIYSSGPMRIPREFTVKGLAETSAGLNKLLKKFETTGPSTVRVS